MKYGLVWFEQHNGLTGLLRDRADAVSCHKGWKPGNPDRN
jgi:hypothetical protein